MKLWIAIRLYFIDLTIAMAEDRFARLAADLPKLRQRRKDLAQLSYAIEQDQPA